MLVEMWFFNLLIPHSCSWRLHFYSAIIQMYYGLIPFYPAQHFVEQLIITMSVLVIKSYYKFKILFHTFQNMFLIGVSNTLYTIIYFPDIK